MHEFLKSLPAYLEPLGGWAYLIVAVIVFLETVIGIGQFLPGSVFLAFTGFLCYLGMFDMRVMFIGVFWGHYAGELLNYYLGRFHARLLFKPGSKYFKPEMLEATEKRITGGGVKLLFISQFFGVFRPVVSVAAGASHYPFLRFLGTMAVGAVFWSGLHLGIGYVFGASWERAAHYLESFMVFVALLVGAVLVWGWLSRRVIEKTTAKLEAGEGKGSRTPNSIEK